MLVTLELSEKEKVTIKIEDVNFAQHAARLTFVHGMEEANRFVKWLNEHGDIHLVDQLNELLNEPSADKVSSTRQKPMALYLEIGDYQKFKILFLDTFIMIEDIEAFLLSKEEPADALQVTKNQNSHFIINMKLTLNPYLPVSKKLCHETSASSFQHNEAMPSAKGKSNGFYYYDSDTELEENEEKEKTTGRSSSKRV